jgi:TRAP-type mannitol/chloroaromatic compound transport system permease large subunit
VVPFIGLQLLMLALLWLFPGLATWLPDRLYG